MDSPGLRSVVDAVFAAEDLFGRPQDMEWTVAENDLWILQSRPISTLGATLQAEADFHAEDRAQEEVRQVLGASSAAGGRSATRDERPWYVNLHSELRAAA